MYFSSTFPHLVKLITTCAVVGKVHENANNKSLFYFGHYFILQGEVLACPQAQTLGEVSPVPHGLTPMPNPKLTPSATALLQHGIQFLLPLKIVPPYTVTSATSSLIS